MIRMQRFASVSRVHSFQIHREMSFWSSSWWPFGEQVERDMSSWPTGLCDVTPKEAECLRKEQAHGAVLIDCREVDERDICQIPGNDVVSVPFSKWTAVNRGQLQLKDILPPQIKDHDTKIVAFCHHGGRSAQVASILSKNGYTHVVNMCGGIHRYSNDIDPKIPRY